MRCRYYKMVVIYNLSVFLPRKFKIILFQALKIISKIQQDRENQQLRISEFSYVLAVVF